MSFVVSSVSTAAMSCFSRRGPMTGSASWNDVFPRLLERARSSPEFRARVRESAARVLALKSVLGLRPPRAP